MAGRLKIPGIKGRLPGLPRYAGPRVSRRGLIAGAAAGGGLVLAWSLMPRQFAPPLSPGRGEYAYGAWLKIGEDGIVTVAVPQLEMGQGVTTVLPQIVAVELGADWRQVAVEPVPPNGAYPNLPLAAAWAPLWRDLLPGLADEADDYFVRRFAESERFTVTADGTSLAAYEEPCRIAAASARGMLSEVAANRWDVSPEECEVAGGFVIHGDKRAGFGELAADAALLDPPDPPPLRPESFAEQPFASDTDAISPYPRIDLPAKVGGSMTFAGDVRLPGMVYAAIRHAPQGDGELAEFDAAKAAGMTGFVGAVRARRWLAAVGTSWWYASLALDAMRPKFRALQAVDSRVNDTLLATAIEQGEAERVLEWGEPDDRLSRIGYISRYVVHPALHAPLETASATARLIDGRLELWIASQAPERARVAAGRAVGLAPEEVVLYPVAAGGSFDRRLELDHAIEAAIIAKEIGRPVQLTWSRAQEHQMTRPRPPLIARVGAEVDPQEGTIRTWHARIAMPPAAREFGERLFDNASAPAAIEAVEGEADPMVCAGAEPLYDIPNCAIDHVPVTLPLPSGRMRANAHGYTAFFNESLIDEIAAGLGRERLSYRIGMLGGDTRMVAVLRRCAAIAGWEGGNIGQGGQGLACHRMGSRDDGGRIACIVEARMGDGGILVDRITAAVDIGRIVNLDIARQQIEGGLLYGMELALAPRLDYERGIPNAARLRDLRLASLATCPEIEVDFIDSPAPPFDPGELGVAVIAPAIANAVHSATGHRLRSLPLLADGA